MDFNICVALDLYIFCFFFRILEFHCFGLLNLFWIFRELVIFFVIFPVFFDIWLILYLFLPWNCQLCILMFVSIPTVPLDFSVLSEFFFVECSRIFSNLDSSIFIFFLFVYPKFIFTGNSSTFCQFSAYSETIWGWFLPSLGLFAELSLFILNLQFS